jgi:hypothetical protein
MKILLFVISLSLVSITPVFADVDMSNQKIGNSDGSLILQFTDNTLRHYKTFSQIIPHIDYGFYDIGDTRIYLDDARINIFGDSFTVKNNYVSIYARGLGDGNYNIQSIYLTNSGIQRDSFRAGVVTEVSTTESIPEIDTPKITIPETVSTIPTSTPDNMLLLGKYTFMTSLKDVIAFDGKIFDRELNPLGDYYANYGQIEGAIVKISISDVKGNVKWNLSAVTNQFGHFGPSTQVENRFSDTGEYKVTINVLHDGNTQIWEFPMFIEQPGAQQRFVLFTTGQTG